MTQSEETIISQLEGVLDLDVLVRIYQTLSDHNVDPGLIGSLVAAEAVAIVASNTNGDKYLLGLTQGGREGLIRYVAQSAGM